MLASAIEPIAATYVGSFAGALTTLSFLPQVIRVYQLKSAHDISYGYLGMFATGVGLWFGYGLLIRSIPVLITNLVTLLLVGAIIFMKWYFQRKAKRPL
jgi:MtN3 and saliva related transmembrane protein